MRARATGTARALASLATITCKPGCEGLLVRELVSRSAHGLRAQRDDQTPGVVHVAGAPSAESEALLADLTFGALVLHEPNTVIVSHASALGDALTDAFCTSLGSQRIEGPWPLLVRSVAPANVLDVRARLLERGRKRFSRVFRLAGGVPAPASHAARQPVHVGFAVVCCSTTRAFVARRFSDMGQLRMAHDARSPSRSFCKAEEAFRLLGSAPLPGQVVVDLGAAPGGWTYACAKRGARVIAVDNGPLKGGALDHKLVEHRREDAYQFHPVPCDWLLCDMLDEPDRVLRLLHLRWFSSAVGAGAGAGARRRQFVVNLKLGRAADPVRLVSEAKSMLEPLCESLLVRQLHHDRDEVTLLGSFI